MADVNEKTYVAVATAQNEKKYSVVAADEDQARARLRIHFKDAALLRDGIVTEIDGTHDTTPRRITDIKVATPTTGTSAGRPVKDAPQA